MYVLSSDLRRKISVCLVSKLPEEPEGIYVVAAIFPALNSSTVQKEGLSGVQFSFLQ